MLQTLEAILQVFFGLDCAEPACISTLSRGFVACVKHACSGTYVAMVLIFQI